MKYLQHEYNHYLVTCPVFVKPSFNDWLAWRNTQAVRFMQENDW